MFYLSLLSIFKNESHIMKEWLEHYINEGVEHFYLIDNDSDDDYNKILDPYIKNGIVELIIDNKKHKQVQHYNKHFFEKCKESEWIIVCDFDEFIFSRNKYSSIKEYLKDVKDDVGQIYIPFKIFGSNNIINQPESVKEQFTKRTYYNNGKYHCMKNNDEILNKTIIKTKYLKSFGLHFSNINMNCKQITSDGRPKIIGDDKNYSNINEIILSNSSLHLNHYVLQSKDWFLNIKSKRGDATSEKLDSVRDIKYFNSYNLHSNKIIDEELKNKKY